PDDLRGRTCVETGLDDDVCKEPSEDLPGLIEGSPLNCADRERGDVLQHGDEVRELGDREGRLPGVRLDLAETELSLLGDLSVVGLPEDPGNSAAHSNSLNVEGRLLKCIRSRPRTHSVLLVRTECISLR